MKELMFTPEMKKTISDAIDVINNIRKQAFASENHQVCDDYGMNQISTDSLQTVTYVLDKLVNKMTHVK